MGHFCSTDPAGLQQTPQLMMEPARAPETTSHPSLEPELERNDQDPATLSKIEDIRIAQEFIHLLRNASLDNHQEKRRI